VEQIGRSIGWRFEFFPRVGLFQTIQTKIGLTGFPNRPDRFSPVGCREEFLSKEVPVVLWLFLFKRGEVLEVGFLSEGFMGSSGQNWSDRFAKHV
jgi:hypothetical protein